MSQIAITIDGKDIQADKGKTILEVCKANGIHVPTLCYHPRLRLVGACRVCVVEVQGARTLMPACTTPVDRDGLVINTKSERVTEARKLVVELLLSSGNHNCLYCEANGRCELQDLVYELKIENPRFPVASPNWPIDDTNPMIFRDLNKCILCGRCVRGCNEVQGNMVIDFGYRGSRAKIVTAYDKNYADSNCVFCGECVQLCPTGALVEAKSIYRGRPWEAEVVSTTCTYCGVGCTIDLHIVDGKVVRATGNEDGVVNKGSLCVKGRFGYDFIHHEERLTKPLIKENGSLREATWDEALTLVADRLAQIKNESGADSIAGLSSARCTNEENYLMQKFMRAVIGTNNVDHCARL
jgi:predicted molibdopterin-dependent oxidoreductase YjgC